jgi:hypothetical protein
MALLKQGAFSEMIPLGPIGSPRAARSRTIDLESNSMQAKVSIPEEKSAFFCEKWLITELALFGSVLRDDFRPDSDIDVLVRFASQAEHTLFDLVHMQEELRDLFGREVDLVERTAIEKSRNWLRRQAILGSAEVLYAA